MTVKMNGLILDSTVLTPDEHVYRAELLKYWVPINIDQSQALVPERIIIFLGYMLIYDLYHPLDLK